MKLLPPQIQGINHLNQLIDEGQRRIVLCSPTGGGKTVMAFNRMTEALSQGKTSLLLTHRRMLFDQLDRNLKRAGFAPGYRAAGMPDYEGPITLAMAQTEYARSYIKDYPKATADLVFVDECHADKGKRMQQMLDYHTSNGSVIVGLSATPVDVGHLFDAIAYAGFHSDLLKCGLHLPLKCYGPDEADLSDLQCRVGRYRESDLEQKFATHAVVGSVARNLKLYNPELKPSVVYAPSVSGSRFLTEGLNSQGIKTAHLDGMNAVWNGEEIRSSRSVRDDMVAALLNGELHAICNRFVLREGIDIPELYCVSLATRMGLTAYIQSCGRVLRNHPSLDHVVIIDHGGNIRTHGAVNWDREFTLTEPEHRQPSPPDDLKGWRCPKCFHMQQKKGVCENCGVKIENKNFSVYQSDGRLKLIETQQPTLYQRLQRDIQKRYDRFFFKMKHRRVPVDLKWAVLQFIKQSHDLNGVVAVFEGHNPATYFIHNTGKRIRMKRVPLPHSPQWFDMVYDAKTSQLQ